MTLTKRLFDLIVSISLVIILCPILLLTALIVLILDGRPVLYVSERMSSPTQDFQLVKFRTMKPSTENTGVSGGDKLNRITRCGHFLRRSRLDEVPQLWNVLKGEISLVGPRPPLRQYVEKFPDLYGRVLKSRPGVTGLASIKYHKHEEMMLARCATSEETDTIYSRACVPRKGQIDLIYQARQNLCFDMYILFMTAFRFLR